MKALIKEFDSPNSNYFKIYVLPEMLNFITELGPDRLIKVEAMGSWGRIWYWGEE